MIDRDRLVDEHAGRVRIEAYKLKRRLPAHVETDDLVSCGMVGLLMAIDCFDPARGIGLWVFAKHRVRGEMFDYVRSLNWDTAVNCDFDQLLDPSPVSMDRRVLIREVREQVDQLRPKQRRVVQMTLRGISSKEIAARSGMTRTAVLVTRHRAVEALQKRMAA